MNQSPDEVPTSGINRPVDLLVAFGHHVKLHRVDSKDNLNQDSQDHSNPSEHDKKKNISKLPRAFKTPNIPKGGAKSCGQFGCSDHAGDSLAGPSKPAYSPPRFKNEGFRLGSEKSKPSFIPRRRATLSNSGSKESAVRVDHNKCYSNKSHIQRLNVVNLGPDFSREDHFTASSMASSRPIPTLGQIYRRNNIVLDGDRLYDWIMELDTPVNSIESQPRNEQSRQYSDSVSTANSIEDVEIGKDFFGDKDRSRRVVDVNMYNTTNDNLSEWLSNEVNCPKENSKSGHCLLSPTNHSPDNIAHNHSGCQAKRSKEMFCSTLSSTSEKAEDNVLKTVMETLSYNKMETPLVELQSPIGEHKTVVIKRILDSNQILSPPMDTKVDKALEPILMNISAQSKKLQYPSMTDPDSKREKQVIAPSYVECASEILQKTTNFEVDGAVVDSETPNTLSSIAGTDHEIRDDYSSQCTIEQLEDSLLEEHLTNATWCHNSPSQQSCITFVKSDDSNPAPLMFSRHCICHGKSIDSADLVKSDYYDEQSHNDTQLNRSSGSTAKWKKYNQFRRFPSYRYKLSCPYNSMRKRTSEKRLCRHRWDHMWKKSAARWGIWSRSHSKIARCQMTRYFQSSVFWEDVNVQTLSLVYQETGTHTNVTEQKSAGMTTSKDLTSTDNKNTEIGASSMTTKSFKSRFKHMNMGPSRFPFFNTKKKTKPVHTLEELTKPAQTYASFTQQPKRVSKSSSQRALYPETTDTVTSPLNLHKPETVDIDTEFHPETTDIVTSPLNLKSKTVDIDTVFHLETTDTVTSPFVLHKPKTVNTNTEIEDVTFQQNSQPFCTETEADENLRPCSIVKEIEYVTFQQNSQPFSTETKADEDLRPCPIVKEIENVTFQQNSQPVSTETKADEDLRPSPKVKEIENVTFQQNSQPVSTETEADENLRPRPIVKENEDVTFHQNSQPVFTETEADENLRPFPIVNDNVRLNLKSQSTLQCSIEINYKESTNNECNVEQSKSIKKENEPLAKKTQSKNTLNFNHGCPPQCQCPVENTSADKRNIHFGTEDLIFPLNEMLKSSLIRSNSTIRIARALASEIATQVVGAINNIETGIVNLAPFAQSYCVENIKDPIPYYKPAVGMNESFQLANNANLDQGGTNAPLDQCRTNASLDQCRTNASLDQCRTNASLDQCRTNASLDQCRTNASLDQCRTNASLDQCRINASLDQCQTNASLDQCWTNVSSDQCRTNVPLDQCRNNAFLDQCPTNAPLARQHRVKQTSVFRSSWAKRWSKKNKHALPTPTVEKQSVQISTSKNVIVNTSVVDSAIEPVSPHLVITGAHILSISSDQLLPVPACTSNSIVKRTGIKEGILSKPNCSASFSTGEEILYQVGKKKTSVTITLDPKKSNETQTEFWENCNEKDEVKKKSYGYTDVSTCTSMPIYITKSTGQSNLQTCYNKSTYTTNTCVQYTHHVYEKSEKEPSRTRIGHSKLISACMLHESMRDSCTQAQPTYYDTETEAVLVHTMPQQTSMSIMTPASQHKATATVSKERYNKLICCKWCARADTETNTHNIMHNKKFSTPNYESSVTSSDKATHNSSTEVHWKSSISKTARSANERFNSPSRLSRFIGQTSSGDQTDVNQNIANSVQCSSLDAADWIKRCTTQGKDYQSLSDMDDSTLKGLTRTSFSLKKSSRSTGSQTSSKIKTIKKSNLCYNVNKVVSPSRSVITQSDDSLSDLPVTTLPKPQNECVPERESKQTVDKVTAGSVKIPSADKTISQTAEPVLTLPRNECVPERESKQMVGKVTSGDTLIKYVESFIQSAQDIKKAGSTLPVETISKSLSKDVAVRDSKQTADKVTSDTLLKHLKETILQTCPDIKEAATCTKTSNAEGQKSASVITSKCVLPSPKPCCFYKNISKDCIFVYERPRCVVHRPCDDASVQSHFLQNDDIVAKPHDAEVSRKHAVEYPTSENPQREVRLFTHREVSNSVIGELLSPKAYKELYERTKLAVEDQSVCPVRDTGMESITKEEQDAAQMKALSTHSAGMVTSECGISQSDICCQPILSDTSKQAEFVYAYNTPSAGSNQTCANWHARLLDIPTYNEDNKKGDYVDELIKSHLVGSCRYYSNLLTKHFGLVKEKVTKHLAQSDKQYLYLSTKTSKPLSFTEECTMKPSGRGELACQTYKARKSRSHVKQDLPKPLSCCVLSPSLTNICEGHEKNHLKSVYFMLSAIEGRIRRLKRNVPG